MTAADQPQASDNQSTPREEMQAFWDRFFETKGWINTRLAELLDTSGETVSRWRTGKICPSGEHLTMMLVRGIFNDDERDQFIRLWCRDKGISPSCFHFFAHAFGAESESDPAAVSPSWSSIRLPVPKNRLMVIYPFPGKSPNYFYTLNGAIVKRATTEGWLIDPHYLSEDLRATQPLHVIQPDFASLVGVIAINCHTDSPNCEWFAECEAADLPLVLVHDNITYEQTLAIQAKRVALIWESLDGLRDIVRHLIVEHGCRQLRVVIPEPNNHFQRQRKLKAIFEAGADAEVTIDRVKHVYATRDYGFSEGVRVARDTLLHDDTVDAVVCMSDELAQGILQEYRRMRRPIRVTGYDNSQTAQVFNITSVDQKLNDIGEWAVQEIVRLMTDQATQSSTITLQELLSARTPCRARCQGTL